MKLSEITKGKIIEAYRDGDDIKAHTIHDGDDNWSVYFGEQHLVSFSGPDAKEIAGDYYLSANAYVRGYFKDVEVQGLREEMQEAYRKLAKAGNEGMSDVAYALYRTYDEHIDMLADFRRQMYRLEDVVGIAYYVGSDNNEQSIANYCNGGIEYAWKLDRTNRAADANHNHELIKLVRTAVAAI